MNCNANANFSIPNKPSFRFNVLQIYIFFNFSLTKSPLKATLIAHVWFSAKLARLQFSSDQIDEYCALECPWNLISVQYFTSHHHIYIGTSSTKAPLQKSWGICTLNWLTLRRYWKIEKGSKIPKQKKKESASIL